MKIKLDLTPDDKQVITDKMTHFLIGLEGNPDLLTAPVSHMCQALDISRESFYQWIKIPEFVTELEKIAGHYFTASKSRMRLKVLEEGLKGSFPDRKLFFQLAGELDGDAPRVNQVINVEIPDWAKDDVK